MAADGWLKMHASDTVAVLTAKAPSGSQPLGHGAALERAVPAGHKLALDTIAQGAPIIKFGQIIGYATQPVAAGEHIHTHNCAMGEHDTAYEIGVDLEQARANIPKVAPGEFMGIHRANGQIGTRNYVALIATVNCSTTVIRQAAFQINTSGMLDDYPNVDGVVAFAHGTGCGMAPDGPGHDNLQRVLWGHATHPNVGAALFVGLGCEVIQIARMKATFGDVGSAERFKGLTIQDSGGTTRTIAAIVDAVAKLLPQANAVTRAPAPASALRVALQCGGSDGFSGITANPALGVASDILVGMGGTVVLAETPEIYGAEQLLLRRAASQEVADKLIERIGWWENYTRINGGTMDNNPSPGNKAGGLTTILEKSLGAAAKGGSTPLTSVIDYGAPADVPGFAFMDSPGYDPASVTGQIATGAQIVVFTTGRGSAFGSKPAPTIKLATNSALAAAMPDDMDLDCGDVLAGVSLEDKGRQIVDMILKVASGEASKSEALGLGDNEFVPWQIGAVM
ncbi:UxaA family hydrolase [Pelagibacterium montanilacus]|uniref:UxaA family hydrolase n=1 Tax=Pelagibacterium montanilacus TaxID=2185280 RepID=UPI000F8CE859|nr:altronate dehydratase family protein [Pelagibacterium montanilacus]